MFKITGNAQTYLVDQVEREKETKDETLYVRLSMGIGWGGPKLNLSLEEQKINGDLSFSFDELNIIIHERDFVYFDHTKLDYVEDVLGKKRFQLIKI